MVGSARRGIDAVAFSRPEIGEVISGRSLRPGVVEGFTREGRVHLGHDGVEAFWVATGGIIHYRVSAELRIPVRNPVCVHEFHPLNPENLSVPER